MNYTNQPESLVLWEVPHPDALEPEHVEGANYVVWPADIGKQRIGVWINTLGLKGAAALDRNKIVKVLRQNRDAIQELARQKFRPGDEKVILEESVLITLVGSMRPRFPAV